MEGVSWSGGKVWGPNFWKSRVHCLGGCQAICISGIYRQPHCPKKQPLPLPDVQQPGQGQAPEQNRHDRGEASEVGVLPVLAGLLLIDWLQSSAVTQSPFPNGASCRDWDLVLETPSLCPRYGWLPLLVPLASPSLRQL